jgi:small multidrug resistance family-3 protein
MLWYHGVPMPVLLTSLALFAATALAELLGCYLVYLFMRKGQPPWLLAPAAGSLALFAWLLTLHPHAAGRTYAAYGGIYVAASVLWLWGVDRQTPDRWDVVGALVSVIGMAIIVLGPRR